MLLKRSGFRATVNCLEDLQLGSVDSIRGIFSARASVKRGVSGCCETRNISKLFEGEVLSVLEEFRIWCSVWRI